MIPAIVRAALKFRGLVLGIAAAIIVIGVVTLRDAPVDVFPEFTPPYVEIQTESLGLSAGEVEQLITVPLEADLLNGVEGVEVLRSSSLPGLSSIVLVFEAGTDVYKGRQLVQERLTQLGGAAFPNVSKPPTMLQPLSSQSRVLMIGLSSEKLTPIERSVIARWTMRPRLTGVPGVANVSVFGMRDQQIQVQVDPRRLADKNVSLAEVVSTAGNAQVASPVSYIEASVPGTGGFIETPQQRFQIRNVFDNIASASELGRVPVEGTGGKLRLNDVADVVQDHQPLIGDAVVGDKDGLLMVIEKFPGADVAKVTRGVENALEDLKPGLAGMQTDTSVFRPLSYLRDALDNLGLTLGIGALLLAAMLTAALRQWRTVLIALVTIPVSLLSAALVLDLMGETFNAISFAGLALALVLVVDDAVAGAEHAARRMRVGSQAPEATLTVLRATREIRSPLGYAALIALVVIVPVVVMEGRPGAFLAPLALAYAVAVAAATIVALTLIPALSLLLGAKRSVADQPGRVSAVYDRALERVLGAPAAVAAGTLACLVAVVSALLLMGPSLVPKIKDPAVLVSLDSKPGTSNTRMTAIATGLSRQLRGIDGVANVAAHVGRAVTGDRIVDVNSSEVVVSMGSGADYDKTYAAIKRTAAGVRGASASVATASTQKIREVGGLMHGENPVTGDGLDVLTGSDKPIIVRLYGQDFATMRRQAARLQQVMSNVEGVVQPRIEEPASQPNIRITVDIDKARRFGVKPGDIRRAEAIMLQGILVGSTFKEQKVFDVIVQGSPRLRESVAGVRDIPIDRPGGGHVRLGDVANVRVINSRTVIKRDAVSRKLDITASVSGRSVTAVANDLEQQVADVQLPLEYHAEVLENTVADEINGGQVVASAIGAALLVLLLLQAAVGSWRIAAAAYLTLPVALAGGIVGALIAGGGLSLGTAIGFLALFVLAARHALTLVCGLQDMEREGGAFGPELVQQGAQRRLIPSLASIAAIGAVMAPFAIAGDVAGLEIINAMALVVLFGLVTLAALSLFVMPALYLRLGAGQEHAASLDEEHDFPPALPSPDGNGQAVVLR